MYQASHVVVRFAQAGPQDGQQHPEAAAGEGNRPCGSCPLQPRRRQQWRPLLPMPTHQQPWTWITLTAPALYLRQRWGLRWPS